MLVSTLAPHTRHLHRDPRACVLLAEEVSGDRDRLAASRVSLMGTMEQLERASDTFAGRGGQRYSDVDDPSERSAVARTV